MKTVPAHARQAAFLRVIKFWASHARGHFCCPFFILASPFIMAIKGAPDCHLPGPEFREFAGFCQRKNQPAGAAA